MTCRAPNSSVTCSGTPTGATLTYDAERRLAHWQNTPTTPTVQDDSLYDGAGQRVEQYVNTSGTITSTAYLAGGVEEVSGGVVTKYLGAKGLPTAVRVGTAGALNYLATDGLGSVSVAVDGSGNLVASQLYAPYGTSRYSSGTMPTSKGFNGQRADATSGLDYYGARYYDPVAGQFTSADSVSQGLSRYAYVGGNPETATDPTGHLLCTVECGSGGGNAGGSGYNGQSCYGSECQPYVPPTILAAFIPAAPVCHADLCSRQNQTNIQQAPTATQVVQMQHSAAVTAHSYAVGFALLTVLLLGLSALFTLLAGSAGPNVFLGGLLLGAALAFGILAGVAAFIGGTFALEALGQSTLTVDSVASASQDVAGVVAAASAGLDLISAPFLLKTLASVIAKAGPSASLGEATAGIPELGLAGGLLSFVAVLSVGAVGLGVLAQTGFDKEEREL